MTDQYPQQQPAQPYAQASPAQPAPQQWPNPPVDTHGHHGQETPPPARSSHTFLIVAGAAVVAVLVLGVGGWAVYDRFIKEDSGIAACRAMAEDKNIDGTAKTSGEDDKLTEAEYREARKIFEDSRHDKIREHGTALMDIAWQVDQMPDGETGGALALLGPMGTHVSGLQTACADEGYIVKMD
ncbi:hypothetical protein O7631_30200 [Micromonospora sp. WMMD967]|uniref:hypothetical protein n=1 Tax=Micromonospora sp. WMMD967 TaxID=3016101 RepID=UPI002416957A|nr:hypothetical protein [Micromonospora sp. WMMD967]MDG4840820.1 hypothetical protein [Micromonospora sp. WMMD967]